MTWMGIKVKREMYRISWPIRLTVIFLLQNFRKK